MDNKIKQLIWDIGKSPKTSSAGSKLVSQRIPLPGWLLDLSTPPMLYLIENIKPSSRANEIYDIQDLGRQKIVLTSPLNSFRVVR